MQVVHVTPGNWRGMVQTKLRNLRSGSQTEYRFRSEDRVDAVALRGLHKWHCAVESVVVGEGDTFEAALADVASAIRFHVETFGADTLNSDPPVLDAFVAEAGVAI